MNLEYAYISLSAGILVEMLIHQVLSVPLVRSNVVCEIRDGRAVYKLRCQSRLRDDVRRRHNAFQK